RFCKTKGKIQEVGQVIGGNPTNFSGSRETVKRKDERSQSRYRRHSGGSTHQPRTGADAPNKICRIGTRWTNFNYTFLTTEFQDLLKPFGLPLWHKALASFSVAAGPCGSAFLLFRSEFGIAPQFRGIYNPRSTW